MPTMSARWPPAEAPVTAMRAGSTWYFAARSKNHLAAWSASLTAAGAGAAGRPFEDNLRIALANQYTRYPLVEPTTDRVVGYVHLKDIVTALASDKRPSRMRELVREPIYASEDTRLEWLRREFQRRRVHIAVILGAGHTFTGIVTLEDLVEEVVGEIQDEQDAEEIPPIRRNLD